MRLTPLSLSSKRTGRGRSPHTLLSYSEELTQNIASTLKNTTVQGCDSASLNVYRKLKMRSLYFADVGFIEKGKITCTAFWGKLANPIALPLSCIKPRTDSVWRSFRRKISLSVMRQFITTLLFSPPVQPTINLPRYRQLFASFFH